MKQALKYLVFFVIGVMLAGGLLYFYADTLFNSSGESPDKTLPEGVAPAERGEALITRISGEVYIIRDDTILTPLPGDRIREGDVIKVVDQSVCQVRFAGTASLKIRSNTLVKIRKLLTGTKDADIRTELLTGSMIYKVEELTDSENLQIQAQERIFRIEGTEFLVQALSGNRTVLSVLNGKVAVFDLDEQAGEVHLKTLGASEQTILNEETEDPVVSALDPEEESSLALDLPEVFSVREAGLIPLLIASRPPGAQIYINGRLNGSSEIRGLFLPDQELTILVRKRGYEDRTVRLIPASGEDREIRIDLTPLGMEQTLEEEKEKQNENSVIQAMQEEYERDLATLRSSFTQKMAAADREQEKLKQSEDFLTEENINLEEELVKSREEARKLRELIQQIQELAGDQ